MANSSQIKKETLIAEGGQACLYLIENGEEKKVEKRYKTFVNDDRAREFEILQLINCAQVVKAESSTYSSIFMPYFKKGDAGRYYNPNGKRRFGEEEAKALLNDGAKALRAFSTAKVIARDISPSNILIRKDEKTKAISFVFCDLGSAFFSTKLLHPTSCGKFAFAAPETLLEVPIFSEKSDIFSLGMTVSLLLLGKLPFPIPLADPGPGVSPLTHRDRCAEIYNVSQELTECDFDSRGPRLTCRLINLLRGMLRLRSAKRFSLESVEKVLARVEPDHILINILQTRNEALERFKSTAQNCNEQLKSTRDVNRKLTAKLLNMQKDRDDAVGKLKEIEAQSKEDQLVLRSCEEKLVAAQNENIQLTEQKKVEKSYYESEIAGFHEQAEKTDTAFSERIDSLTSQILNAESAKSASEMSVTTSDNLVKEKELEIKKVTASCDKVSVELATCQTQLSGSQQLVLTLKIQIEDLKSAGEHRNNLLGELTTARAVIATHGQQSTASESTISELRKTVSSHLAKLASARQNNVYFLTFRSNFIK